MFSAKKQEAAEPSMSELRRNVQQDPARQAGPRQNQVQHRADHHSAAQMTAADDPLGLNDPLLLEKILAEEAKRQRNAPHMRHGWVRLQRISIITHHYDAGCQC